MTVSENHRIEPSRAPLPESDTHRPRFDPVDDLFLTTDLRTREIRALARRVAATAVPVLILGESGVGKGELARLIHEASPRAGRPFVKVNCSAMPHELLESEMFGHERGSFTGAHQRKEGKFELADGGTLLLDEIGEMDPSLQAKLLHVLEDWTFSRVGGNQSLRVDTRIISTTNRPLEDAIAEGDFRKDLYFRLKVVCFRIPPLRERRADIALLCQRFVHDFSLLQPELPTSLPDRLLRAFGEYHWPGNVRELKHLVQRYLILPDVELILSELGDMPVHPEDDEPLPDTRAPEPLIELETSGGGRISLKTIAARAAEEAEKRVILQVLEATHWNRRRAAARLDICYKTLLNKLHLWNLYDQPPEAPFPTLGTTLPISPSAGPPYEVTGLA